MAPGVKIVIWEDGGLGTFHDKPSHSYRHLIRLGMATWCLADAKFEATALDTLNTWMRWLCLTAQIELGGKWRSPGRRSSRYLQENGIISIARSRLIWWGKRDQLRARYANIAWIELPKYGAKPRSILWRLQSKFKASSPGMEPSLAPYVGNEAKDWINSHPWADVVRHV